MLKKYKTAKLISNVIYGYISKTEDLLDFGAKLTMQLQEEVVLINDQFEFEYMGKKHYLHSEDYFVITNEDVLVFATLSELNKEVTFVGKGIDLY
jgi:hypothetical protein